MKNNSSLLDISVILSKPANLEKWLESLRPPAFYQNHINQGGNWKPLYFIAMTARSGSTMLCSLIKKLEHLGTPEEYLNPRGPFQIYHSKYGGENFEEYLKNIFNQMQAESTMLGIKTAFLDFFPVASQFNEKIVEFANFIYLTRLNIYSQSVSLWSAKKTQLWHSEDGTRSKISISDYNYSEILICLTQLLAERIKWETYFAFYGILPHRVAYEDLCANQETVLRSLVNFLGMQISDEKIDGIIPETTVLSTDIQKEIVEKFSEDFISRRETMKYLEKKIF
jgi:LPS sulfotransferase NodH